MAVALRLKRTGRRNSPSYQIVAAHKASKRDGKPIEILGTYDPKKEGKNYEINLERALYWVGVGGQPSQTVNSIIKKSKEAQSA